MQEDTKNGPVAVSSLVQRVMRRLQDADAGSGFNPCLLEDLDALVAAQRSANHLSRHDRLAAYWRRIEEQANEAGVSMPSCPRGHHWMQWSARRGSGVFYRVGIAARHTNVGVHIPVAGSPSGYQSGAAVWDALLRHREEINPAFAPLEPVWKADGRRSRSVAVRVSGGYENARQAEIEVLVNTLRRVTEVIGPLLARLP